MITRGTTIYTLILFFFLTVPVDARAQSVLFEDGFPFTGGIKKQLETLKKDGVIQITNSSGGNINNVTSATAHSDDGAMYTSIQTINASGNDADNVHVEIKSSHDNAEYATTVSSEAKEGSVVQIMHSSTDEKNLPLSQPQLLLVGP